MTKYAGDPERLAADAIRPIIGQAVKELGLGADETEAFMLWMAEAYLKGRTDGADGFSQQVNLALSAEGIPLAVVLKHGTVQLSTEDRAEG